MKNLLGVMQGRLLPKYKNKFQAHPVGNWNKEFVIASKLGFDCIEFILDYDQCDANPLLTNHGLKEILFYSKSNGVFVKSICADYFMESPIFDEKIEIRKQNLKIFQKLIKSANQIGVTDIVLPLVDKSSILNDNAKQISAIKFIQELIKNCKHYDVNICIEADLPPDEFLKFIKKINEKNVKINYDTGNSACSGYNFVEEFNLYGDFVTNIHIKDRNFNKGSIELGQGDFNFQKFFKFLSTKEYKGIFILQAYRGVNALSSLIPQYSFIKAIMEKYYYN